MKKTLFLVRHAQASSSVSPDLFRPLTSGGMIDAARMSRHLAEKLAGLELIITSNAERTRMTSQVFCEQLKLDEGIIREDASLYESTPKYYLDAVNAIPESLTSVMLVGHNPSISYFAEYLTHEDIGSMPTCAVVGMTFENLTWAEVSKKTGHMTIYDSPDSVLGFKLD